jgi:hypothetical protein
MKAKHKIRCALGLLVFGLIFQHGVSAQSEVEKFTARNGIYLEAGGSSGRYAVNFSRIFYQKGKLKLNASAGFSLSRSSIDFDSYTSKKWLPVLPLEFSGFYGKRNHHLELGFGVIFFLDQAIELNPDTFEFYPRTVFGTILPTRIGYRYQKPEGGFFYRVGYTPFFKLPLATGDDLSFQPWFAGVSIGKSF